MVSKTATLITKKSSTAGVVPAAGALQPAELAINTADRKLYSKDNAGAVFEVGGRKGKAVGDVVSYEASGLGSIRGIMTAGDATVFGRTDTKPADFANFWFYRNLTTGVGGSFGNTSGNVIIQTDVNADTAVSEWALITKLFVYQPSNQAQHCSAYNQAWVYADSSSWALCTELGDNTANPTTGRISIECNASGYGPDPNNQRFALHIATGRSQRAKEENRTDNVISRGAIITTDQYTIMKKGVHLLGRFNTGMDLTGMDPVISADAISMLASQRINYRTAQDGAVIGSVGWDQANGSLALSGASLATLTVGAAGSGQALPSLPAGYLRMTINGTPIKLPYYNN